MYHVITRMFAFGSRQADGNGAVPPVSTWNQTSPLSASVPAHLRGRAEFMSVLGELARAKRNWQLAAFGSLGASMLLAGGLVSMTARSHITPYVVEVDRLGRAQAFGPAETLRFTDRRVIASQLAMFVHDLRTVAGDPVAQSDLVRRAYAFADQNAAAFLNSYFADAANDPRLLGRDQARLVEITSVLPVPGAVMPGIDSGVGDARDSGRRNDLPTTWKVSWTETTLPRNAGGLSEQSAWEGYLTTRLVPPRDAERITLNPLGLYVTSVTWTRMSVPTEPSNDGSRRPNDGHDAAIADPSQPTAGVSSLPSGGRP